MTRRQTLVALAVIAAIAVAVPAIAQDLQGQQFLDSRAKKIEEELRKTAHKALKKSNKALKLAKKARIPGPAGQQGQAGPPGTSSAPRFAEAPGMETTADDTQFVQLPGGPSVTVNVPQAASGPAGTGFIEVTASARVSDEAGAVALYEDGSNLSQNEQCELQLGTPEPPLFASPDGFGGGVWGTPGAFQPFFCATAGDPGPVTFITTPGTHTYELRYNYCGCSGTDADFSERRLWVTPLG